MRCDWESSGNSKLDRAGQQKSSVFLTLCNFRECDFPRGWTPQLLRFPTERVVQGVARGTWSGRNGRGVESLPGLLDGLLWGSAPGNDPIDKEIDPDNQRTEHQLYVPRESGRIEHRQDVVLHEASLVPLKPGARPEP